MRGGRGVPGQHVQQQGDRRALVRRGHRARFPTWEYASPRDFGGHGSHTASTAGGNHDIQPTGDAAAFGAISGMAPCARIAIYKACFVITLGTSGSCNSLDTARRHRPGRRRRRRRHSTTRSPARDELHEHTEVAFLFAARRGRLRRRVGRQLGPDGLDGRAPEPVDHDGRRRHAQPRRQRHGDDRQRRVYNGSRRSPNAVHGPRSSTRSPRACPARTPSNLALCFGAADRRRDARSGKVAGKIVRLRPRRRRARINKSLAVQQAGGVGMMLVNTSAELAQRRPALRPDGPPGRHEPGCGQGVHAATRRDGDDLEGRRSSPTCRRRSPRRSRRAARSSRAAATS